MALTLEEQVLLHRYCYYVLAHPLLPDAEYDKIEREARSVYPVDSVVHQIGSSLASSYSEDIRALAHKLTGEV